MFGLFTTHDSLQRYGIAHGDAPAPQPTLAMNHHAYFNYLYQRLWPQPIRRWLAFAAIRRDHNAVRANVANGKLACITPMLLLAHNQCKRADLLLLIPMQAYDQN